MNRFSQDPNNRVAGNALVGLHLAGIAEAASRTLSMARSPRTERRRTAAWVMGQIASPEFAARLTELTRDDFPQVRAAAVHALRLLSTAEARRRKEILDEVPAEVELAAPEAPRPEPEIELNINLDGSSFATRVRRQLGFR